MPKETWTVDEWRAYEAKKQGVKGKARNSFCLSRHHHPSKSEADYCNWLLAEKKSGKIKSYSLYPSVDLHVKGKLWRKWKIDFLVIETDGGTSYHESKGWCRSDDRFRMKLAAFRLEYPKIPIYVNKKRITSKGWFRENYRANARIENTFRR